jgi:4-oxalocrotonate tautomerase
MPIVNLKITKGARRAEKAQIVAEFTDTLRRVLGKNSEHIHVVIEEVDEANWGFGGMLTDEYRAGAPVAVAAAASYAPPPAVPAPIQLPPPPPPPPVAQAIFAPPAASAALFSQQAAQPSVRQNPVYPVVQPPVSPVFTPPPPQPSPVAVADSPVSAPDPDAPPPRVMIERTPGAKEEEIYVDMMSGGFACLRSVMAENLGREVFRIVEEMPENEAWKYGPGSVVRVKKQKLSTGKALVAYEEVFLQEVK